MNVRAVVYVYIRAWWRHFPIGLPSFSSWLFCGITLVDPGRLEEKTSWMQVITTLPYGVRKSVVARGTFGCYSNTLMVALHQDSPAKLPLNSRMMTTFIFFTRWVAQCVCELWIFVLVEGWCGPVDFLRWTATYVRQRNNTEIGRQHGRQSDILRGAAEPNKWCRCWHCIDCIRDTAGRHMGLWSLLLCWSEFVSRCGWGHEQSRCGSHLWGLNSWSSLASSHCISLVEMKRLNVTVLWLHTSV